MPADFTRLVSLACHDLRTPLATVSGFAKTLLRQDGLEDPAGRYLGMIDAAADELVELLDILSLAARIEGGRYDPMLRVVDSLELVPDATGSGAPVEVDVEAAERALRALAHGAARHGGIEVVVSVEGPVVSIEPVVESAAAIVLGDDPKDLGSALAVGLLRALGAEVALEGERLRITLPQPA